jgi:hypothetical protein
MTTEPTPPNHSAPKRHKRWPWIVGGIVGLFVLLVVVGALAGDPKKEGPAPVATATRTPAGTPYSPPAETTPVPSPSAITVPKPKPFKAVTAREWKLIAKNSDDYVGDRIIVHGQVTQFDSATGPDTFLADADGPRRDAFEYSQQTMFIGDESDLTKVVEDDLFTAKVVVLGPTSFDTQIGGNTTVPTLQVMSIKVTGSAG